MKHFPMLATILSGWLAVGATTAVADITHVPAANPKAPGGVAGFDHDRDREWDDD
jgi:hypothetical protein